MKLRREASLWSDVESELRSLVRRIARQRANSKWMCCESVHAEAGEAEETVRSWCPVEVGWNSDADEVVVFTYHVSFLANAVFEESSEPWVDEGGNVDSCGCDEIVPDRVSIGCIVSDMSYHEVRA